MRLLVLLLVAAPLWGDRWGSDWKVAGITPNSISICATFDNPTDATWRGKIERTKTGTFPLDIIPSDLEVCYTGGSAFNDRCCVRSVTLTPNTEYTLFPAFYNGSDYIDYTDARSQTEIQGLDCNSIPSSASAGEAECEVVADGDGSGNYTIRVRTPDYDSGTDLGYDDPTAPDVSSIDQLTALPEIDHESTVTTFSWDGESVCSNLQGLMDSESLWLEGQADGSVAAVKIPAGAVCYPECENGSGDSCATPDQYWYTFPATASKPNSRLIVYSEPLDADSALPFGVAPPKTYSVGRISFSREHYAPYTRALMEFESGTTNPTFYNVLFVEPMPGKWDIPTMPGSIDTNAGVELDTALNTTEFPTADVEFGANFPCAKGIAYRWGFDTHQAANGWAGLWHWYATAKRRHRSAPPTNYANCSGEGFLYVPQPHLIASASATQITFARDHWLLEGYEFTVSSYSGTTVTVSEAHAIQAPNGYPSVMYVENATGSGCDGFHTIANSGTSGSDIALADNMDACTDADADDTIRELPVIGLHALEGITPTRLTCAVKVIDADTVEPVLCHSGSGQVTPDFTDLTGGYMTFQPRTMPSYMRFDGATGVSLINVGFVGFEGSRHDVILDMDEGDAPYLYGVSFWDLMLSRYTHPYTQDAHRVDRSLRSNLTRDIACDSLDGAVLRNVQTNTLGFFMFCQDRGDAIPQDVLVDGLRQDPPWEIIVNSPIESPIRQLVLEAKGGGQRWRFNGVSSVGSVLSVGNSPALFQWGIGDQGSGSSSRTMLTARDLLIENSSFGEFNLGLSGICNVAIVASTNADIEPCSRLKIYNTLWRQKERRASPYGEFLNVAGSNTAAQGDIYRIGRLDQFQLVKTTILSPEGDDSWSLIGNINPKLGAQKVVDACLVDSGGSAGNHRWYTPAASTAWSTLEDAMERDEEGTLSANSAIANILHIQGNDTPTRWDLDWQQDATGAAQISSEAIWDVADFNATGRVTMLESDSSETLQERYDKVFEAGSWVPKSAYSSYNCADPVAIRRAQRQVLLEQVRVRTGELEAQIEAYSDSAACEIKWAATGTDLWGASSGVSSASFSSGEYQRTGEFEPGSGTLDIAVVCAGGGISVREGVVIP